MAPVGSFAFSVPGRRRATVPSTDTTNSGRTRLACSWAAGASALSMTTWVIPCLVAQVERKMSCPWSRSTMGPQPASRALIRVRSAESWPHAWVR